MARELSTQHLQMYKPGHELSKLFDCVVSDPELSFEIRINDTAMVYYNKKKILTISLKKGKISISPLSDKYYQPGEEPKVDISAPENWKRVSAIEQYLKDSKWLVYKKDMKKEFQLQQSFSLGNRDTRNRYLVIDMEWQFSQESIDKNNRIKATRPDLVVLDLQPNQEGENVIYLAEVKLGTDALLGKSGLEDHVISTKKIAECMPACAALVADVKKILVQKQELGIIKGDIPELKLSSKPKMMFLMGYRGDDERNEIEKAMSKIIPIPKVLDGSVVIYHDALITINSCVVTKI